MLGCLWYAVMLSQGCEWWYIFSNFSPEAVADLVYLLNTLVDKDGKILITGLHDDVAPLTANEASLYDNIEFDVPEYKCGIGSPKLMHNEDKVFLSVNKFLY